MQIGGSFMRKGTALFMFFVCAAMIVGLFLIAFQPDPLSNDEARYLTFESGTYQSIPSGYETWQDPFDD
jgi:hypothetical protein